MQNAIRQYWLPAGVYVCRTQDGTVLLDVRRDRYLGLGAAQSRALASVVAGWPVLPQEAVANLQPVTAAHSARIAELLVERGLLTRDHSCGKAATPVRLDQAAATVAIGDDPVNHRSIQLLDIVCFVWACASTKLALKMLPFRTVVAKTMRRKQHGSARAPRFDEHRAAALVGVFRRLRRYAFTGNGQCLFQALSLVRFLSHYRLYPTLVIGVRTCPWGAHSWVQEGALVLDSTPEEACGYTPILTI